MSKKTRTVSNKAGKLMKCDGQMLKKVIEAKGYKLYELSRMLRYCSDYLTSCCRTNKISDVAAKYLMDYKIFPQMYDLEGEIKIDEPKEVKIDKDEKKYIESDKKATDDLKERMDRINENSTYGIPKPDKEIQFCTRYGVVRSEKDLRDCIKRATDPKAPLWGSNLVEVRDILEKACGNGLKYNVEDMRNDLLVYATKVNHPENWVFFVERLNLVNEGSPFDPTAQEIKKVLNEKYGEKRPGRYPYAASNVISDAKENLYSDGSDMLSLGLKHFFKGIMREIKNDPEIKAIIKQAVKEAYEEL